MGERENLRVRAVRLDFDLDGQAVARWLKSSNDIRKDTRFYYSNVRQPTSMFPVGVYRAAFGMNRIIQKDISTGLTYPYAQP